MGTIDEDALYLALKTTFINRNTLPLPTDVPQPPKRALKFRVKRISVVPVCKFAFKLQIYTQEQHASFDHFSELPFTES